MVYKLLFIIYLVTTYALQHIFHFILNYLLPDSNLLTLGMTGLKWLGHDDFPKDPAKNLVLAPHNQGDGAGEATAADMGTGYSICCVSTSLRVNCHWTLDTVPSTYY